MELIDTQGLGSCAEKREGLSPFRRTNFQGCDIVKVPTVDELVKSKSRSELDQIYLELTGSACACCNTKSAVASQIVRYLREQNLAEAYTRIVV